MTFNRQEPSVLSSFVEKATEFHGHLGPFLVIGVRMGLIGLKKLDAKPNDKQLSVTASLPLHVPFSCIIDGLQVTTKCTVGNQKLTVKNSEEIQAEFKRGSSRGMVVALSDSAFEKLKAQLLREGMSDEEVCDLAWKVAAMSEGELFAVRQQRLRK